MKKVIFLLLTVITLLFAAPVDQSLAQKVAKNWYQQGAPLQLKDSKIIHATAQKQNGVTVYYTFTFQKGGFIIVSADDRAMPLIGYSFTGTIDEENMPPALKNLLNLCGRQIIDLSKQNSAPAVEQWSEILNNKFSTEIVKSSIEPLIKTYWGQGNPYNLYTPNNWPVGCVATAMTMIMDYYQQPKQGTGTHSYYSNSTGQILTADFGNTVYEWKKMLSAYDIFSAIPQPAKEWVARLSSHCGISVDMNYGPTGSGSGIGKALYAFKTYFGYHQEAIIKQRDNYSADQWKDLIVSELLLNRPLLYAGSGAAVGHVFICDGYDAVSNMLHFNWGWDGGLNGYFAVDGLSNIGSNHYSFNDGQSAIFNLFDYKVVPNNVTLVTAVNLDNGNQFKLTWEKQQDANFKNYKVYLGKKSFDYYSSQITTDTTIILSGLQNDSLYFAGVTVEGLNGQESRLSETSCIVTNAPLAPLQVKATPQLFKIKISWQHNPEPDLTGYDLYRSQDNINFIKINTALVNEIQYTDSFVNPLNFYYYKVRGVDSDGNQGSFSEVVKARAVSLQSGILIVNETPSGEGNVYHPNQQMADHFYSIITAGSNSTVLDLNEVGNKVSLSDIGLYSTIIWHNQVVGNSNVFSTCQSEISAYLDLGGQLLINADRPVELSSGFLNYPSGFASTGFTVKYLGIDSVFMKPVSRFNHAIPANSSYCVLNTDTAKAQDIYNNHLKKMEAFKPAAGAQIIYTYGSDYAAGTNMGSLVGKAVGIIKTTGNAKVVTLSVPLYFIQQNDARELMVKILRDEFGETVGIDSPDNLANGTDLKLSSYPNPFNPVTKINFELKTANFAKLSVYNANGQIVKTLFEGVLQSGKHNVNFNAAGLNSGVYFYKLETPAGSAINKALLIK